MKKVLINANSIVQKTSLSHLSGIGRSTLSLLNALAKMDKLPFEIVLYSQRVKSGGLTRYQFPFKTMRIPLPLIDRFTKIIKLLRLRELFSGYDLYHVPQNTDDCVANLEKSIFTIHDLMIYRFPDLFPHTEQFDRDIRHLVRKCKSIVTCSECSKKDIVEYWNLSEEKVTVIPWGIDRLIFYPETQAEIVKTTAKYSIESSFFLAVSCSHPRKNIELVLKAFQIYSKENLIHKLVLVWGNPPEKLLNEYADEISSGKILFLNHIDDTELRALYSGAVATLFPSLYEGFGFPVLESFACHTPVITCRNSSLIEMGSDIAYYTSETNANELVVLLHSFDTTDCVPTNFVERVEDHLKNYTWEKTASLYVKYYLKNLE
jgi:glycosyltransferase involved in cell wall biosynthesis